MVTQSTRNYSEYKQQIYEIVKNKYGEDRAKQFIKFFSSRYDKYQRSFMDYRLAIALMDDYKYLESIGTKWYAFVGVGGSGKTTIAKNIFYYLDPTFTHARMKTEIKPFIQVLATFPAVKAMKGAFLDEPDDSIHTSSKDGKQLRKIFGKIRQQHSIIGICATDLIDIPAYIFRKLDGIIFTPYLSKGMFFKNRPKQKSYILQKIRFEYNKKGYQVFFDLQYEAGCLVFDTHKATPLDYEHKQYLKDKAADFEKDFKDFLIKPKDKKESIPERDKIIISLKQKGKTSEEIASLVELSKRRINQIIKQYE